jgi:hypothetical protein
METPRPVQRLGLDRRSGGGDMGEKTVNPAGAPIVTVKTPSQPYTRGVFLRDLRKVSVKKPTVK